MILDKYLIYGVKLRRFFLSKKNLKNCNKRLKNFHSLKTSLHSVFQNRNTELVSTN
jgi:hypothetical protein